MSDTGAPANGDAPDLRRFLNPRSIALFGASEDMSNLRGRITRLIPEKGYSGELYLINPGRDTILGRPAFASMSEVGVGVDLAIMVIPAPQVVPALRDCAELGVGNALILSSGFGEGGAGGESDLAEIARASGMRICGPNTVGFYNETDKLAATFSPAVELDPDRLFTAALSRVGIVAQSGGLGFSLYHRGRLMGLSFSKVITTGNEADLNAADFLSFLAEDPDTKGILLFLETVRDGRAFMAALDQAAAANKPVVAVKVGRSTAAGRATVSHTGAIAGWDAAYDAMFARHGVTVADDLDRAVAIMAGFMTNPLPRGRNAGIVTVSGGAGALAADRLTAAGFDVPELGPSLQQELGAFLPAYAALANPVDVTGQASRTAAPLEAIRALDRSDEVDLLVMAATMSRDVPPVDVDGLIDFVGGERKPLFFYTYTLPSEFGLRALARANMVTFSSLDDITAAAAAMHDYRLFLDEAEARGPRRGAAGRRLGEPAGILAEHRAKDLLAAHGVAVGPRTLLRDAEDALDVPRDWFPAAAKIQSPDIPHKTEANGIRLNIADPAALVQAHGQILSAAGDFRPDARIEGILVEPMADPGIEMIVGVVRDPLFGPVVTVGAGGVTAELIRDVARRLGPISEAEALRMLRSLRSFPLLDGYRGRPRADVAALARLVATLSEFAADHEDVAEVEINPVIVHAEGLTLVDALIVCRS